MVKSEVQIEMKHDDVVARARNLVHVEARRVLGEPVCPRKLSEEGVAVREPGDTSVACRLHTVDGVVFVALKTYVTLGDVLGYI